MRILGIDLGTNSIGWAIVELLNGNYTPLSKENAGVLIFQEGVTYEKNNEKPTVADRTKARSIRRKYARHRIHKVDLLKVLIKHRLCPSLTDDELKLWRNKKIYPKNEDFLSWQRTDDNRDKNPYHDRYIALNTTLDLIKEADRFLLGRAIYHLAQRRGFLSNRKDSTPEKDDGVIKQSISSLDTEMTEAGCDYIGEYFYKLYRENRKIRCRHIHRERHCLAELEAICRKQSLSKDIFDELYKAIFYQRPLKSQKGLVGKCTFEKKKSRCPISHPRFEEFRLYSILNNIKIKTPGDEDLRPLNEEERDAIIPLFSRKSDFTFETLAKKLVGKKSSYSFVGDKQETDYVFNYPLTTSLSCNPVTEGLISIFGEDWLREICSIYTRAEGKTPDEILNDVWHALFSFDNDEKLQAWAQNNLQLSEEQAQKFIHIPARQGYASLSLNAINKILPYMRQGMRYDEAVFLANLKAALPDDCSHYEAIEAEVLRAITDYEHRSPEDKKGSTKETCIIDCLRQLGYTDIRENRLYHPSMIDLYPKSKNGLLDTPRASAWRNPMALRALFYLRKLINSLLREGKIDADTLIRIEFARELNDANKRAAIRLWQQENEKSRAKAITEIKKLYKEETGRDVEPSDNDILKYRLWEEQGHICLYTGNRISLSQFIGENPIYDIEHTVPLSRGGDNSMMNKTLCESRYNRDTKRGHLPSELADYKKTMAIVETLGWKKKIDELKKQIDRTKGYCATKEAKDIQIRKRHLLKMELAYWQGKYDRLTMTEVPEGFSARQGVDIGIIGRYARMYLSSVFPHISTVKGATTAEFRVMWGLQNEYTRKERVNHVHHCIDAIVIACIGRTEYEQWAQYKTKSEHCRWQGNKAPSFEKPWETFTEDVKHIADELIISHQTAHNMPKPGRKCWRIRGVIQRDENGNTLYQQGHTARGVLHKDTFYGAIMRDDEIKYVVRKRLSDLEEKQVEKIVDDVVRQKVQEAIAERGFKTAMAGPIYMNEEKGIEIKKVRIYATQVTSPIDLKSHRDLSRHEYKQKYHVVNDSNYCMAIYQGTNAKGKTIRSYQLINMLEAARYFNSDRQEGLVPDSDRDGNPLWCVLRPGTMVLFYENTPRELHECSQADLVKRLYKVTGLSSLTLQKKYFYGTLVLKHHQEARPAGEIKAKNGEWKQGEEYRPVIFVYHTQLKAYIEGSDFQISATGEITLNRP